MTSPEEPSVPIRRPAKLSDDRMFDPVPGLPPEQWEFTLDEAEDEEPPAPEVTERPKGNKDDPLRKQILEFLRDHVEQEGPVIEADPVPIDGGSSNHVFSFSASWFNGKKRMRRDMILRQESEAPIVEADIAQENILLNALRITELPVPKVQWADLEPAWFDRRSLIFQRARGKADRAVLRDKDPLGLGLEGRTKLANKIATLLANLHLVDPAGISLDMVMTYPDDAVMTEFGRWDYVIDKHSLDPEGRLRAARDWLLVNQVRSPDYLSVVHGDFRPANIMVEFGRIAALLDWELAHLGDPAEDLGWYTCSIYRKEHFLEGWGVEEFLAQYVESGGEEPEPERLKYWQVFAVFKLAIIALRAARNAESGASDKPAPPVDRVIDQLNADIA
jgi:aminoglycoside phosphotransferase (APT) family kinase protein